MDILEELRKPFGEKEIEWRVQQCGISNNKPWAMVLCYVQARAIQNRLDHVFGWNGWKVEYRTCNGDTNIICRISVYDETTKEWIYKEDGASESNVEPFKGGISGSLKRCASSGFGIGRYLYNLTENFAICSHEKPKDLTDWKKAQAKVKEGNKEVRKTIYWKAPPLPEWALPKKVTATEVSNLIEVGKKANISLPSILKVIKHDFGIDMIEQLTLDQYNEVSERLNKKVGASNDKH
ncbi:Rad52/Rad22 family DNA repair protein [Clostridium sp. LP20]|uniref:Rad52/Rad22 family DNA repair protein n=1 Tax=Clostridium sp. LP20 TaxID=3418665 RepID=UPI003EE584EA